MSSCAQLMSCADASQLISPEMAEMGVGEMREIAGYAELSERDAKEVGEQSHIYLYSNAFDRTSSVIDARMRVTPGESPEVFAIEGGFVLSLSVRRMSGEASRHGWSPYLISGFSAYAGARQLFPAIFYEASLDFDGASGYFFPSADPRRYHQTSDYSRMRAADVAEMRIWGYGKICTRLT